MQTGVPQGSILGPLLFIIYMNDICESSALFDFILYADDTTLSAPLGEFRFSSTGENPSHPTINLELNKIFKWLTANKLSLNVDKTKFMIFHFPQHKLDKSRIPLIEINGVTIQQVHDFNFLGITITDTLSWHAHIEKIATKISRTIGILNRLKHTVNSDTLRVIYNSLILSHLNFGLLSWGSSTNRIFKLQKKAVRSIAKAKYNSHTEPLFQLLNLLKISDLYQLKLLKFYFKLRNGTLPCYFNNLFPYNADINTYTTRQSNQLYVPIAKHTMVKQSIRYCLPPTINSTPEPILSKINTHSYHGFSLYIKKHMLQQYTFLCTNNNCYVCKS